MKRQVIQVMTAMAVAVALAGPASAQGKGCGRQLYAALFDYAREAGFDSVVCEYDLDPPNPVSAAFHARFGFVEVGRQMANGKQVSMQSAALDVDAR